MKEKQSMTITPLEAEKKRRGILHPVHARFHGDTAPIGVRLANAIIGFMGSWPFLIVQTVLVTI